MLTECALGPQREESGRKGKSNKKKEKFHEKKVDRCPEGAHLSTGK